MKTITLIARLWTDTSGNTYHTVSIYLDGRPAGRSGVHYGYEKQYVETAQERLHIGGKVPPSRSQMLSRWCFENGVDLHCEEIRVARRKDLTA